MLERFQRRGVSLVSAESLDTGSAADGLVINIMTALSQWEHDAVRHNKSNSQRVGNIAYGFRLAPDGEHLEPDAHEQEVLTAIRDLRAGRCTLRGIAVELNARGWRTRRASAWRLEHVARIVGRRTSAAK